MAGTAISASIDGMSSITVRDLDPAIKERLRVRAARHGRSMEEEVRVILRMAMAEGTITPTRLADSIGRRFAGIDAELTLSDPESVRQPPKLR